MSPLRKRKKICWAITAILNGTHYVQAFVETKNLNLSMSKKLAALAKLAEKL